MSRNLFDRFQAARDANEPQANPSTIEMGQVPQDRIALQDFQAEVEQVEARVDRLEVITRELEVMQKQAANIVTEAESNSAQRKLQTLTDEGNSISNQAGSILQGMKREIQALPNDADARIRRNQHAALTRRILSVLSAYQNSQRMNREAARERFARQYRIIHPDAKETEVQEALDDTHSPLFSNQLLQETRGARARMALKAAESRQKDVAKLGASIEEVQQLFLNLQRMTEEQGAMLDSIEGNAANAEAAMGRADTQLGAAVKSAISARKKRWCLFIIFLIIVIIIVVVCLVEFLPRNN